MFKKKMLRDFFIGIIIFSVDLATVASFYEIFLYNKLTNFLPFFITSQLLLLVGSFVLYITLLSPFLDEVDLVDSINPFVWFLFSTIEVSFLIACFLIMYVLHPMW